MSWLHRFAVLLAACTVVLVLLGALVTSLGAGLSVPAWPSTFGDVTGTGTRLAGAGLQQAHRLVAALVGLLAVVVAVLAWRADPRPWMKGLSVAAVALVAAQAVYGGVGVWNHLPAFFSVFHAALAQLFLALTIAMALFTSRGWLETEPTSERGTVDRVLARTAVASTALIYLQVLVGAGMRHSFTADGRPAGFAIPDYPLAFGRVLPLSELSSWATSLGYFHRVTALVTTVLVALVAVRVFRRHLEEDGLVRPAALLALVLLAQIALGGLTVVSGGHPAVSTTHAWVVTAALAASLVIAIRSYAGLGIAGTSGARDTRTVAKGTAE